MPHSATVVVPLAYCLMFFMCRKYSRRSSSVISSGDFQQNPVSVL
jgi:hypothetical protein